MSVIATAGSPTRDFAIGELTTDSGRTLHGLRLRYRVLGDVEAAAENGWILVFHALTGSAEVDVWWGPLVGPGKALDTTRHAIVAANLLGSCYGSSGPLEWRTEHNRPFPELTPADLARSHIPLLEHLGVHHLALATGGSLGGMVALEWGRLSSVPTDRLVVFAAPAAASPQAIGWNVVQRMAIEADQAWAGGNYPPG
ncbi:MAG TPA: alpha/beta fold hydrolase, partial [Gemmatimonadales bacterium]|nr:alpha/beta fold hydrolase [Gemmatimonadales bacterium]